MVEKHPQPPKRAPVTARLLALRVLRDIETRNGHSNRILSRHLERHPQLDPRDRGLATTLVYGVLRHRRRLDHLIDTFADAPAKLKGEPRMALRIAAFELRELERPAPIAISEAATLVRTIARSGGLAALTHAILKPIDRDGNAIDEATAAAKTLDALELRWSIPRWLAGRWIKQLGPDVALARAEAVSRAPPLDVRIDTGATTRQAVIERIRIDHPGALIQVPAEHPRALRLRSAGDVFHGPLHDEGLISVQALGAQQPAATLSPQPGWRVLDACAGMGTKTLQLAELMQRKGTLVAADTSGERLADIDDIVRRGRLDAEGLALSRIEADLTGEVADIDDEPFDAVLVDAPCTGLGNLARHPEIRWRARFEDIADRSALQRRLLDRCLTRVRSGGRLVYAVCSLEPEEGPEIVAAVADRATVKGEQTWTPETHDTDGFYLALLEPR